MSPLLPTVVPHVPLNSTATTLFGIAPARFEVVDFNGSRTSLLPPTGPHRVGIQHLTIKHDLGDKPTHPPLCSRNSTLPVMRQNFGEDGELYFDAFCKGVRYIQASVFYPACTTKGPLPNAAKVFTPSLLDYVTNELFGDPLAFHNLDSQALLNASVCPGEYSLAMLTPPIGGQRQSYTQLATELVSTNAQIVVTVDHAFQSGAVELDERRILTNLAGALIKPREANYARVVDLLAIAHHFHNSSNFDQATWKSVTIEPNNTYVLGHGQGGMVSQMLVGTNVFPSGGSLDGRIGMPAPYTEKNVLYINRSSTLRQSANIIIQSPPDTTLDRLRKMARGLKQTMMDTLSGLMCRILATCGNVVEKRELFKKDIFKDLPNIQESLPNVQDTDYRLFDADGNNEYEKYFSDLCFYHCARSCRPRVPHGIFPNNTSIREGKTRPEDSDPSRWDPAWYDYHDDPRLGDYTGRPRGRPPGAICFSRTHCLQLCYPAVSPLHQNPSLIPEANDREEEPKQDGMEIDIGFGDHVDDFGDDAAEFGDDVDDSGDDVVYANNPSDGNDKS